MPNRFHATLAIHANVWVVALAHCNEIAIEALLTTGNIAVTIVVDGCDFNGLYALTATGVQNAAVCQNVDAAGLGLGCQITIGVSPCIHHSLHSHAGV